MIKAPGMKSDDVFGMNSPADTRVAAAATRLRREATFMARKAMRDRMLCQG